MVPDQPAQDLSRRALSLTYKLVARSIRKFGRLIMSHDMPGASERSAARVTYLDFRPTWIVVCVVVASCYLVPKLTGALISNPKTVWPLWPGCAILVAGLLVVPLRIWPLLIPAALAGVASYDLQAGVPISSIAWFICADAVQVLIVASGLRYCFHGLPQLNSKEALAKYSFFAVLLGPLAAAFISAAGIGRDYWMSWRICFFSDVLAFVTVLPAILSWGGNTETWKGRTRGYYVEAGAQLAALVLLGSLTLTSSGISSSPALLYSLVPILLWSALRIGWRGISTSLVIVAFLTIWGAAHGRGPFAEHGPLGNPLWFQLQLFLIFAAAPFMVLAAAVEERKLAESTLVDTNVRLETAYALSRAMLESVPGLALLVNGDGMILRTNRGAGHAAEDFHPLFQRIRVGENYLDWLRELQASANWQPGIVNPVARVIEGGSKRATLEWQMPYGDQWVEVCALRLNQPQGYSLVVHWDITTRKSAELERAETLDTIAHLNRVSAMGQMAASLAHELGQPLAAILSNSQAAKRLANRSEPDLDEIRNALADIVEDDQRAREVVENLRSILHKGKVPLCEVDLNRIVNDVARLVRNNVLLRGVNLRLALSSDPISVRGAIVPLQQVILNLINNSMDSMRGLDPEHRIVTVSTAVDRERRFGFVLVEDCGPGIPDHVKPKLFSPFFTTKDDGLGLGLSICHSIVQSLGGDIHLEDRMHPGAAFRVEFPLLVEHTPTTTSAVLSR